jgi:papain fold toxin 2 of polymorphic toxin system
MPQDSKQIAAAAAQGYKLFQCEECADNIEKALIRAGYSGQRIELRSGQGYPFMGCLSYDGAWTSITQNGRHVAIRIEDIVFDNLHPSGMPYDQWLSDFFAPTSVVLYRVDSF